MRSRRSNRRRGSVLLEFALTIPLFLVLLMGMLEYGYYFYVAVSATNAAREGARQCTLVSLGGCGDCNPSNAVSYMAKIGLGNNTTASATCSNTNGDIAYTIKVAVTFPSLSGYPPVLGTMPQSGTDGHSIAYGSAVMRGQ